MNSYKRNKERVRQMAIDWQAEFSENSYTWAELADYSDLFTRLGRRWGLLREFRENGIC